MKWTIRKIQWAVMETTEGTHVEHLANGWQEEAPRKALPVIVVSDKGHNNVL